MVPNSILKINVNGYGNLYWMLLKYRNSYFKLVGVYTGINILKLIEIGKRTCIGSCSNLYGTPYRKFVKNGTDTGTHMTLATA